MDREKEIHTCSICHADYVGYGNNAQPINDGRCCNRCNDLVVEARIRQLWKRRADESHTDRPLQ